LLQRFRPRQPVEAKPDDAVGKLLRRLRTGRDGVRTLGQRDRPEPLAAAAAQAPRGGVEGDVI